MLDKECNFHCVVCGPLFLGLFYFCFYSVRIFSVFVFIVLLYCYCVLVAGCAMGCAMGCFFGMVQITPVLVNTGRAESYPDVL